MRTQRKSKIKGGNRITPGKISTISKTVKDNEGNDIEEDITKEFVDKITNTEESIYNRRMNGETLRFKINDNQYYTIQFNPKVENEGQFNLGVGTVLEEPEWFARIQNVSSNDERVILTGTLLHDLSPVYFVKYRGIYKITTISVAEKKPIENYSLELMDKVDFTLFKYVVHYIKTVLQQQPKDLSENNPKEEQLNQMLDELCPMMYSLWFQKIILEEMKYAKYNERYIDFKADNIGLVFKPDESNLMCVYFDGLDVALPIKFKLLGQPTTVRMVLFDQQIQTNGIYTPVEHAYIYMCMKSLWSLYGRTDIDKRLKLNSFRTDSKNKSDKDLFTKYFISSICLNEKAYNYLIQNLFVSEKYKPFYEICVNIDIVNDLFLKDNITQLNTTMKAWGIKLLYTDVITLEELKDENNNNKGFTKSFYENIHSNDIEDLIKFYINSGIDTLQYHTNLALQSIQIKGVQFYNYNDKIQEIFKLVAYLKDEDFNKFIVIIDEIKKEITDYYNKVYKDRNIYYKWLIPEYIRIYNDQWINIYSTWRSLVREHFILGAPRGTKIHLLEARNEQFRFAPVFKDLLDLANVQFPFGKDKDKDTRLEVPFTSVIIPQPSEEASLSLDEFIDILSNAK